MIVQAYEKTKSQELEDKIKKQKELLKNLEEQLEEAKDEEIEIPKPKDVHYYFLDLEKLCNKHLRNLKKDAEGYYNSPAVYQEIFKIMYGDDVFQKITKGT
jgi:hypothetical protein